MPLVSHKMCAQLSLEGEGRSRAARAGWGDLSTRAMFNAERLSPHPASHSASLHAIRPSPSRGGWHLACGSSAMMRDLSVHRTRRIHEHSE
ncbi:hypothetical protein FXV83_23635 [Bradyrhizobium hipponense]|uniref:Uncharacterized protein n=1 Tax=Bradyrhizobium hipponense TaxID=2605638 RepID=A0A5S4YI31_9BRAD|nr:hypothetical protein FXV83_23635 [Bradyrhizobium hipponense]